MNFDEFTKLVLMVIKERKLNPENYTLYEVFELYEIGNTPVMVVKLLTRGRK